MVRKFKIVALAGALLMAASPAFAQDPLGDITKGLGDLDPLHVLSPAPAAAPAAGPAKKHARHRHHGKHHAVKHAAAKHHAGGKHHAAKRAKKK